MYKNIDNMLIYQISGKDLNIPNSCENCEDSKSKSLHFGGKLYSICHQKIRCFLDTISPEKKTDIDLSDLILSIYTYDFYLNYYDPNRLLKIFTIENKICIHFKMLIFKEHNIYIESLMQAFEDNYKINHFERIMVGYPLENKHTDYQSIGKKDIGVLLSFIDLYFEISCNPIEYKIFEFDDTYSVFEFSILFDF